MIEKEREILLTAQLANVKKQLQAIERALALVQKQMASLEQAIVEFESNKEMTARLRRDARAAKA